MDQPLSLADLIRTTTAQLNALRDTQDQLMAAVREIQAVLTFGTHSDLTGLDDELDNLYGGAL